MYIIIIIIIIIIIVIIIIIIICFLSFIPCRRLQSISLGSIRRLREFTNSTLVDILFYTSPTYCKVSFKHITD